MIGEAFATSFGNAQAPAGAAFASYLKCFGAADFVVAMIGLMLFAIIRLRMDQKAGVAEAESKQGVQDSPS